jgi:hypothetical protein
LAWAKPKAKQASMSQRRQRIGKVLSNRVMMVSSKQMRQFGEDKSSVKKEIDAHQVHTASVLEFSSINSAIDFSVIRN